MDSSGRFRYFSLLLLSIFMLARFLFLLPRIRENINVFGLLLSVSRSDTERARIKAALSTAGCHSPIICAKESLIRCREHFVREQ